MGGHLMGSHLMGRCPDRSIVLGFPLNFRWRWTAFRYHGTDRHRWRTPYQSGLANLHPCQGLTLPYHLASYSKPQVGSGQPAFIYRGGPWLYQLYSLSSLHYYWELSIVPPRLIISSNRAGLEPNLPPDSTAYITSTLSALYFHFLRNVFDLLRYIARSYVERIPNRITYPFHLQFSNS
jgi:hypothetical protein